MEEEREGHRNQDNKRVIEINRKKWAVYGGRMREAEEMKGCLLICSLTGELKLISETSVCL